MALLTSPDILPEAMRFLVRGLLVFKGGEADRDELVDLIAPRGLVEAMMSLGGDAPSEDDDDEEQEQRSGLRSGGHLIATNSLDALRMLGIVTQSSGRVLLEEQAADRWKRPTDVNPRAFRNFLLDRVFESADANAAPGSSDGVTDLMRALELLYVAKDPMRPVSRYETVTNGTRSFEELLTAAFGDRHELWPILGKTRWKPFCRWASYLGLARKIGANSIIPDASEALAARLSDLPSGSYDAGDFVSRCAETVPLLDGGVLQSRHAPERAGATEVLSPALSLSVMQLEADGMVKLDKRSDTDVRILRLRADRSADRPITTVEWTQGAREGRIA